MLNQNLYSDRGPVEAGAVVAVFTVLFQNFFSVMYDNAVF